MITPAYSSVNIFLQRACSQSGNGWRVLWGAGTVSFTTLSLGRVTGSWPAVGIPDTSSISRLYAPCRLISGAFLEVLNFCSVEEETKLPSPKTSS